MNGQRVKKVERLIRPFITTLILIALVLSVYSTLDTLKKNNEIRHINTKIEKQNERLEEMLLKNEEIHQQKLEENKRINDVIIRLNLQLDQLDSQ